MELDPFSNLPVEKIEEICDILDIKSLGRFMKTSRRNNLICQRVLNLRRMDFLLSKLVGYWERCQLLQMIEDISIIDEGNFIVIGTNPWPIDELQIDMEEEEEDTPYSYRGVMVKSLENLEFLYSKIQEIGFIKFDKNKDFSAYEKSSDEVLVYYPKSDPDRPRPWGKVNLDSAFEKIQIKELAKKLGIKITEKESRFELKDLIVKEMKRRNKYISCQS